METGYNMNNQTARISTGGFVLLAVLIGFFILAYFPVLKGLVLAWSSSEEYSHGFLIIPISAFILWNKRQLLAGITFTSSGAGIGVILFSLCLYVIASYSGIITLASFTMILTIAGMVIYFFGLRAFKGLLFPLAFLLFMIPVPSQIYSAATIPLQLFVTKVSIWAASLAGMPIYREGNVIYLPDHTLQVVNACSGLRSMVSLLMLSAIFGYLTLTSNLSRTILFFSGIPVSILVNIIRVLLMISAFYYFDYDLATGSTHTLFGIGIFFVALLIIYLLKEVLAIWERRISLK
jgi:exosortase A